MKPTKHLHPIFNSMVTFGYPKQKAEAAYSAWLAEGRPVEVRTWLVNWGVPAPVVAKALTKAGTTLEDMTQTFASARAATQRVKQTAESAMTTLQACIDRKHL